MRNTRGVVQQCDRRSQLPNHAESRIDVQDHAALFGAREHFGESQAGSAFGNQRQGAASIAQPVDPASPREIRVLEGGEVANSLAQRKLEGGDARELVAEAQNFQGRVELTRDGWTVPLAEAVLERRDRGARRGGASCIGRHFFMGICGDRTAISVIVSSTSRFSK